MPVTDFEKEFLLELRMIGAEGTKKASPIISPEPTQAIETVDTVPEVATSGGPVLVSKVNLQNIFRHPDAHPIVLDLLLIRKFGVDWMGWETETVEMRILETFKTPSVSESNLAKIFSISTLHLVDTFWERWEVFNWCTAALNGFSPNLEVLQVPTVAQILVAVDIANRVRDDMVWAPEIRYFIESVYRHDDIFHPVPPADFVAIDTTDYPIDLVEIAKLWPDVRASGKVPSEETVTNEQLRRLLVVTNYLEESRLHLRQQLPLVSNVPA